MLQTSFRLPESGRTIVVLADSLSVTPAGLLNSELLPHKHFCSEQLKLPQNRSMDRSLLLARELSDFCSPSSYTRGCPVFAFLSLINFVDEELTYANPLCCHREADREQRNEENKRKNALLAFPKSPAGGGFA